MSVIPQPDGFQIATEAHRAGNLLAAETGYRRVLRRDPAHAETLHLLGLIAHQTGRDRTAAQLIEQAIAADGSQAAYHCNLGVIHEALGAHLDAARCFQHALELRPNHAAAHFNLARALHDRGETDPAIKHFRHAAALNPNLPDAHRSLGNLHYDVGDYHAAAEAFARAARLQPGSAALRYALGTAYHELGKIAAAVFEFREALRLDPQSAAVWCRLGNALRQQDHLNESVDCYRRALATGPEDSSVLFNLGNALHAVGKPDEAVACYRRVLQIEPGLMQAAYNLGTLLTEQESLAEAESVFRAALEVDAECADAYGGLGILLMRCDRIDESVSALQTAAMLKPDSAEIWNNLANALTLDGKATEALACCEKSLALRPDCCETCTSKGNALIDGDQPAAAIDAFRRAIEIDPKNVTAHFNLGTLLKEQSSPREAVAALSEAIRLQPDHASAHLSRAFVWLLDGNWECGWREYEWRFRIPECPPRAFEQPLWDGSPLCGQTLLVHAEQGLGDTLNFIRYAAHAKHRGGRIVVECQKPLLRLLARTPGIDQLVARGEALPAFDLHVPLLSLPRIFRTLPHNVPCNIPYISADAQLVEHWRKELDGIAGYKIGICWQGNPTYSKDERRSFPIRSFEALRDLPGVQLINLQKGETADELNAPGKPQMHAFGDRLDRQAGPFMDTLAILQHLDLVIAPDTSLAHLAGATGLPVWLALAHLHDARWMLDRDDTPWYPATRLFRQPNPGNWDAVFSRMKHELEELLAAQASCENKRVARQRPIDGLDVAGFARIQPERSEFLRIPLPVKSDLTEHEIPSRWK